ncbi:EboA domain-containing protein [Streptomyces sp. NPDC005962]|uniref:EboA domain-containing protein n=1 Tax=Streptomyces sp. NPDC005962 TaxID=3154466 RepID=UPI0033DDDA9B
MLIADLRATVRERLDTDAATWLDRALAEASATATAATQGPTPTWEADFAAAARHCRNSGQSSQNSQNGQNRELADATRILLLHAARPDIPTLTRLYTHGTAAERRAVLLSLPYLDPGPDALPLIEDALRTNDTRLVAAAVGPYAARHLGTHGWRQAVLKCLFTGVSIDAVAEWPARARGDAELARMLTDYAHERGAAGRDVPADLNRVLARAAHTTPEEP